MSALHEQVFQIVTDGASNLAIGFVVVLLVCLLLIATETPFQRTPRRK